MTRIQRKNIAGKRGFTLVELLVVIGIIALLISILLPALSSARRTAAAAKCLSNLHQVGVAMIMYAQQYNGRMPASEIGGQTYYYSAPPLAYQVGGTGLEVLWWQRLQIDKFLPGGADASHGPMVCPSDDHPYQPFAGTTGQQILFNSSYGLNDFMSIWNYNYPSTGPVPKDEITTAGGPYRRYDWPNVLQINNSSEKVFIADNLSGCLLEPWYPNTPQAISGYAYPDNYPNQFDWRRHANPHSKRGQTNVLFLDGHAATVRQGMTSTSNPTQDDPNFSADICGLASTSSSTIITRAEHQLLPNF
jgi:prepilin-type N-terminal cleavage/methylation domain-containing protein/prepilin-type processing-associated H-X9-DG protein